MHMDYEDSGICPSRASGGGKDHVRHRDLVLWNAMLAVHARTGVWTRLRASLRFQQMPEHDQLSWNAIVSALAQNGHLKRSSTEWFLVKLEGLKPNGVVLMSILSACSHMELVEESWRYFTAMGHDYGIVPMRRHYCCIVDVLGRAGQLKDAEELINFMPFEPNELAWLTLLGACKIHRDVKHAKQAAEHVSALDPANGAPHVFVITHFSYIGVGD